MAKIIADDAPGAANGLEELLSGLDDACGRRPAPSRTQIEDLKNLRRTIAQMVRAGRWEEAKNCQALALDLLGRDRVDADRG